MGQAAATPEETPSVQDDISPDMSESNEDSLEEQLHHFQIEESEGIETRSESKQQDGIQTDFELALKLFQDEVEANQNILADRKMAESMGRALFEDDAIIATLNNQEAVARNDRRVALAIEHHGRVQETIETDVQDTTQDLVEISFMENMRRLAMKENYQIVLQHHTSTINKSISSPESSAAAARRNPLLDILLPHIEEGSCIACADTMEIFDLARLQCGHDYCRTCVTKLFADSMADESLFPPRCCRQNIKVEHVRAFLDDDMATRFMERKEELETSNRTYCREQRCSKFIGKGAIQEDIGHCTCGVATCCICKSAPHQGADCQEDPALNSVLQLATATGWKRCYACSRLIELTHGCNHMVCHCGAEFCYECEAPWRTCECEQWSEDRLLGRARAIQQRNLDRTHQPGDVDEEEANQELQTIAQDLRANHICAHDNWQYIPGSHQCEECTHTLPSYIFECRQCHLRACWRCRNNRL